MTLRGVYKNGVVILEASTEKVNVSSAMELGG